MDRYYIAEEKLYQDWRPVKGFCRFSGSAGFGDEMRTVLVVKEGSRIPDNTDYVRYKEIPKEKAYKIAGKDEKYSFPVLFESMITVEASALYFFTPEAAKDVIGKYEFKKVLEHGAAESEKYV